MFESTFRLSFFSSLTLLFFTPWRSLFRRHYLEVLLMSSFAGSSRTTGMLRNSFVSIPVLNFLFRHIFLFFRLTFRNNLTSILFLFLTLLTSLTFPASLTHPAPLTHPAHPTPYTLPIPWSHFMVQRIHIFSLSLLIRLERLFILLVRLLVQHLLCLHNVDLPQLHHLVFLTQVAH